MSTIKLKSRYNENNTLEKVTGNVYTLKSEHYYRIGYNGSEKDITFIDPSGGPFMTVGSEIEGRKIKSLSLSKDKQPLIEFEDDLSSNTQSRTI